MRIPRIRLRALLALVAIVGAILGADRTGYRAGLRDAVPCMLHTTIPTTPAIGSNPGSSPDNVTLSFNVKDPREASEARRLQARLRSENRPFTVREDR